MLLAPTASEETAIQSRVELLQSRSLARQTADSLKLINDPEFAPSANGANLVGQLFAYLQPSVTTALTPSEREKVDERAREEAVTDNLVAHLNVVRNGRSNMISITATSHEPMKAARIANRIVDFTSATSSTRPTARGASRSTRSRPAHRLRAASSRRRIRPRHPSARSMAC